MDAFSFLLGLAAGLVLLPSAIGVVVLCRKLGVEVSLDPLKSLLRKLRDKV